MPTPASQDTVLGSLNSLSSVIGRRMTRALAGPIAILILIPVLVCGVGLVVSLTGWYSQQSTIEGLATRRFREQAEQARWQVEEALAQGDAVLGALADFVTDRGVAFDPRDFTRCLAGQFRGRSTLAFLGIGDPQGNYHGIFPDHPAGREPRLVLTERRMQPNGKSHLRDYEITQQGNTPYREDPEFGFDPRTRPWYLLADRERTRIATDPYPWYDAGLVGVTVADPLLDEAGNLLAVVEIDFNLNSLSRHVESLQERYGALILIHSQKGEILAQAGLRQQAARNQMGQGEIPMLADLTDPLFAAYFRSFNPAFPEEAPRNLVHEKERFLATALPIDIPGEPEWRVVCLGSLDAMMQSARDTMWKGVAVTFGAMLVATVIAVWFARHIVATHVRASRAERAARHAQAAMREMGAYRLCRVLGEGGMGEVWLAEHRLLARPVALKLIHNRSLEQATDADQRRLLTRFKNEARALAQLRSPHTIDIFDFGVSDDGDMFYVMELLDGLDLYGLVSQFGPQPVGRAKAILLQAARSLAEAHDRGLLHRDIKPANIYLCRQADELDIVKVLDFGMVRWLQGAPETDEKPDTDQLTVHGRLEGTPAYMAPEQARQESKDLGAPTDLYALALVGWYLLTGKHLFARKTQAETLVAQLNEKPPALDAVLERLIPPDWESLLRDCLAKSPAQRPPSMREFIRRLEETAVPDGEAWHDEQCTAWWAAIPAPDFSIHRGDGISAERALQVQRSDPAGIPPVDRAVATVVLPKS